MSLLDAATKAALEKLINEDLEHATVMTASVAILDDGGILVDEITLRLEDGRHVAVDVAPPSDAREMVLEIRDEYDPGPPVVRGGWRPATVEQDYADDLADLTHEVPLVEMKQDAAAAQAEAVLAIEKRATEALEGPHPDAKVPNVTIPGG